MRCKSLQCKALFLYISILCYNFATFDQLYNKERSVVTYEKILCIYFIFDCRFSRRGILGISAVTTIRAATGECAKRSIIDHRTWYNRQ